MEAPTICEQFRFVGVECLAPVSNGITKAKTRISLLPRTVAWRVGSHEQRLFTAGKTLVQLATTLSRSAVVCSAGSHCR